MSANQLPRPTGGLTHGMSRDQGEHRCPVCWRDGGPGHHLIPIQNGPGLPTWARPAKPQPTAGARAARPRTCNYWSAREREYCGTTDKVRVFPGGIGPRCPVHDPAVTTAAYKAAAEARR